MINTLPKLDAIPFPEITRRQLRILQLNLGYLCNQQCLHCHVNASPHRKEIMTQATVNDVLGFVERTPELQWADLTGGAPELNPHFRELVVALREHGLKVIDRCNLTILEYEGQQDLASFLAQHRVQIVASLPCYESANVDSQRGKGVYEASIRGLKILNDLGYGQSGSGLELNLVYNPQGPVLPPSQQALEQDYKQRLYQDWGIVFNQLLTLANMPIQRFGSTLISKGQFDDYMQLLQSNHQQDNLSHVMCRDLISVDWRGFVYDCDFNQMLGLDCGLNPNEKTHISQLDAKYLDNAPIRVAGHCFGCSAGQGSSCGGALDAMG